MPVAQTCGPQGPKVKPAARLDPNGLHAEPENEEIIETHGVARKLTRPTSGQR